MVDAFVQSWGSILALIVVFGSIVDLFQFSWIIRRMYKKWQRGLMEKARREILASEYERHLRGSSESK